MILSLKLQDWLMLLYEIEHSEHMKNSSDGNFDILADKSLNHAYSLNNLHRRFRSLLSEQLKVFKTLYIAMCGRIITFFPFRSFCPASLSVRII